MDDSEEIRSGRSRKSKMSLQIGSSSGSRSRSRPAIGKKFYREEPFDKTDNSKSRSRSKNPLSPKSKDSSSKERNSKSNDRSDSIFQIRLNKFDTNSGKPDSYSGDKTQSDLLKFRSGVALRHKMDKIIDGNRQTSHSKEDNGYLSRSSEEQEKKKRENFYKLRKDLIKFNNSDEPTSAVMLD